MTDLERVVAVVTGAAVGSGRAIAERLGREGAVVVAADVDVCGGEETVRRIAAAGGEARFARADVRVAADLEALVAEAGALRILVNNAGGGGHVPPHFPDATPAAWGAALDLNLRSAMLATQLALESMRRAGGGAIVNVASTAGLGLAPYRSPEYAAAKAGLVRFTSTLGPLHERMGVRVNCVVPDWILTERGGRARRDDPGRARGGARAAAARSADRRGGRPRPRRRRGGAGRRVAGRRAATVARAGRGGMIGPCAASTSTPPTSTATTSRTATTTHT